MSREDKDLADLIIALTNLQNDKLEEMGNQIKSLSDKIDPVVEIMGHINFGKRVVIGALAFVALVAGAITSWDIIIKNFK